MVRDPNLDNNNLDNDSFYLSKPLRTNFQINFNKIMSNIQQSASNGGNHNNSQEDNNNFTFLQPFKSERFNQNFKTIKSKITSNLRLQPYSLTKPTKLINNDKLSSLQTSLFNNSNNNSSTTTTSPTPSNNNAILARINSMSSTLRSLFNKSKNGTKIDISNLTSKKKNDSNNKSLNNSDQENQQEQEDECQIDNDSQQQQQDGYSKGSETFNEYLLKLSTTSNSSSLSSAIIYDNENHLKERIQELSKEYKELIKTNKQHLQQQRQQNKYSSKSFIDDSIATTSSNSLLTGSNSTSKLPKWTCLVCLNKNRDLIDLYCSICGSAKTSTSTHSYASSTGSIIDHTFTKPSFQKQINQNKSSIFGKLTTNTTSSISSTSSAVSPPSSEVTTIRKFSKTWLCPHCEYANDNLKIVCVNCRTPKSEMKLDLSPQVKRKIPHTVDSASTASSNSSVCSSNYCGSNSTITITKVGGKAQLFDVSNNDDEVKQPSSKRLKDVNGDQLCSSCQHPIEKDQVPKEKLIDDLVTPTKPASIFNFSTSISTASSSLPKIAEEKASEVTNGSAKNSSQPSLATLFGANDKWSCKMCLVQNSNDKEKCACCETPRTNETAPSFNKKPIELPTQATIQKTSSNQQSSLATLFGANNKWSCKTCLVDNTNDKEKCVCCESPREPNSSSTKEASSTFGAIGGGIKLSNKNDQISFGSKTPAAGPITFGSSSFSFAKPAETSTTTSSENSENKNTNVPAFSFKPNLSTAPTIILNNNAPSDNAPPKSLLNFGAPATSQLLSTQSTSSFGTTPDISAAPKPTFNFGGNNTASVSTGGLTFGKQDINSDINKTTSNSNLLSSGGLSNNNLFPTLNKTETTTTQPKINQANMFSSSLAIPPATTTSSFGSLFGSSNTGFTSTQAQTKDTTATTTSSLFGNNAQSSSLFGNSSSNVASNNSISSSLFGNSNATTATNSIFAFGSNSLSSAPSALATTTITTPLSGGIFGNNQSSSSTTAPAPVSTFSTATPGLFGSNSLTTNTNANSIFGGGNNSSGTFTFGNNTSTTTAQSTSTPNFGIFNSTPAAPTTSSNSEGGFKSSASSSNLFSLSTKPQTTTPSPFLFGSSNNNPPPPAQQQTSSFGGNSFTGFQTTNPTTTAPSSTNFFNNNDSSKVFTFGSNTATTTSSTASPSPFLFGSDEQSHKPHTTPSSLFGNSNTGFTSTQSQTKDTTATTTSSLFGNNAHSSSLFGNSSSNVASNNFISSSLFGNSNATTATNSIFAIGSNSLSSAPSALATTTTTTPLSGGIFGNNQSSSSTTAPAPVSTFSTSSLISNYGNFNSQAAQTPSFNFTAQAPNINITSTPTSNTLGASSDRFEFNSKNSAQPLYTLYKKPTSTPGRLYKNP